MNEAFNILIASVKEANLLREMPTGLWLSTLPKLKEKPEGKPEP